MVTVRMRAFVKRNHGSGEATLYGNTGNSDDENENDFDEFGFWDDDATQHTAIVEVEFEMPDPAPVPIVKARVV